MNLSNFEKYALTKEEIYYSGENIQKLINNERLKNMTKEFDLIRFFKEGFKIAVILITPSQVAISYGVRDIDHSDLYNYMSNYISKQGLRNPMIEVRCSSNVNNKMCYPVLHSKSTIPKEMKEVLRRIHRQFDEIKQNVSLFDIEEFEDLMNSSKLQEIKTIEEENIVGFSLLEFMKQLETQKNNALLNKKSDVTCIDDDFESER